MTKRLDIIHVFPELSLAGAEIVMLNLIRGTSNLLRHHVITSDISETSFLAEVRAAGAEISLLPSLRRHPIKFMTGMRTIVCAKKPAVVHSWMYQANFAAMAVPRKTPVVWSFHGETLSHKLLPMIAELVLIPASYFLPSAIVFPSQTTLRNYKCAGFKSGISEYIHNPVDTSIYFPDAEAGKNYRLSRSYPSGLMIGCAARWHPEKGHLHLFDSLRKALDDGADITLACAGRYMDNRNVDVKEAIRARGLEDRVLLLGLETDMRGFYNSLDLLVVPSKTEAFGNVIIEAYACGLPVISTSCGGPLEIIVDKEHIVAVGDVNAMSSALHKFAIGQWCPSTHGLVDYARRYSLAVIGESYVGMYQRQKV